MSHVSQFYLPTKIVSGPGAVARLPQELQALTSSNASKALIVTDQGIAGSPLFPAFLAQLDESGVPYAVYDGISGEAKTEHVHAALKRFEENRCGFVIGFGGGSSMDVAKGVGLLAVNGGDLLDYAGMRKFTRPPLPVIAVPTTAGTGSEVTDAAVFVDGKTKVKFTVRHPELNRPKLAILDPQLLRTIPPFVAKISGLDALTHAVESFVSLKATEMTEAFSYRAIQLIAGNLESFVSRPDDVSVAQLMLTGSNLAGIAFSHAGTGNVHCLARYIGGLYEIPHGLLCALLLPRVVAFNVPSQIGKFAVIARMFDERLNGTSDEEAANRLPEMLLALLQRLELPVRLNRLGVREEDLRDIAQASANSWYNDYNPRFTTEEDFFQILKQCY